MNTNKTLTRYALYTVLVAIALSCDEKTYKTEIVPNATTRLLLFIRIVFLLYTFFVLVAWITYGVVNWS